MLLTAFTTSAFANCRLAILDSSIPANYIPTAEVNLKGYELISESELQVGDLIATIEKRDTSAKWSQLRGSMVRKEKITQVVGVVQELPEIIASGVITTKFKAKIIGQYFSFPVDGYELKLLEARIEKLPTCKAVTKKINK